MPKFVIERNIPGASGLSGQQLRDIAAKSNAVVAALGEPYEWLTTYVAGDKLYCVHEAESAEAVYKHAREGGFPADMVTEVAAVIGPATANGVASTRVGNLHSLEIVRVQTVPLPVRNLY